MFRFLKPVKGVVFFACLWLTLAVTVEVLAAKWIERAINLIQSLHASSAAKNVSFRQWIWTDASVEAQNFRHVISVLVILVTATVLLRYLKEVSNSKMSMNLVYYIREAIYDKLQRVGFAFHDALSSGQLINRALSDLQNVRAFVQTAVLTTSGHRAGRRRLHHSADHHQPMAGAALAGAAADLDLLHPPIQQDRTAGGQSR